MKAREVYAAHHLEVGPHFVGDMFFPQRARPGAPTWPKWALSRGLDPVWGSEDEVIEREDGSVLVLAEADNDFLDLVKEWVEEEEV